MSQATSLANLISTIKELHKQTPVRHILFEVGTCKKKVSGSIASYYYISEHNQYWFGNKPVTDAPMYVVGPDEYAELELMLALGLDQRAIYIHFLKQSIERNYQC